MVPLTRVYITGFILHRNSIGPIWLCGPGEFMGLNGSRLEETVRYEEATRRFGKPHKCKNGVCMMELKSGKIGSQNAELSR